MLHFLTNVDSQGQQLKRNDTGIRSSTVICPPNYKDCHYKWSPDSKVHEANMGPTWVLSALDGPHVGPMNLAIRVLIRLHICWNKTTIHKQTCWCIYVYNVYIYIYSFRYESSVYAFFIHISEYPYLPTVTIRSISTRILNVIRELPEIRMTHHQVRIL